MRGIKRFATLSFIILLLVIGGFLYWKQQEDVRELNKILPQEIRVVKTINGKYLVDNKADGYQFGIPETWKGLEKIQYIPEWKEKGFIGRSINLRGKKGNSRIIAVDKFQVEDLESLSLESWANNNLKAFGLEGDLNKEKIGSLNIVKTKEEARLLGMNIYFFKGTAGIYALTGGSEEFIKYIINNGKW